MKIAILSSFYPLRGGISQFNTSLLAELGKCNDTLALSFSRQYPAFLFPGKTQYVDATDSAAPVQARAVLDTLDPLSWKRTARIIREWGANLLIVRYWMSWFGPSLGYVARNAGCPCLAIVDNVIPHEPHFFDKPLTRYFLNGCKGFICLSESVEKDLLQLRSDAPHTVIPHPLYDHFGEPVPKEEACRKLGLDPSLKTLLFFGLIRKYKGLDILLEAFRTLPEDYQLVVAGEPYGSFEPYQAIIDSLPGKDRVHLFLKYIGDSEVKDYFCASDLAVLPYRSATQSGIAAIAYHFSLPMAVTDVGGLRESTEGRGTGIVAPTPEPEAVKAQILRFFADEKLQSSCREAIGREKERLSWSNFCARLTAFAQTL